VTDNTNPTLVTATIDGDSTLDLSFAADETGFSTIIVRATDSGALWVEDTLTVTVSPVNDPPVVASAMGDTTVAEDNLPIGNYRDMKDVFFDLEDGTALAFTVESNSDAALVNATIGADSALDLSFGANLSGTAVIVVRATDSGAMWVEDTLTVTVTPVNDPPIVASAMPDTTVAESNGPIDNYRDLNNVFIDAEEGSALDFFVAYNSDTALVSVSIDGDSALDLSFTPAQSGTATIVIRATDTGALAVDDTVVVVVSGTPSAAPDPIIPERFTLYQNAPNPFNPTTVIRFDVATSTPVELRIYDVSGRLVRTLVTGVMPAARHRVVWDGRDDRGVGVSTGVYFYSLVTREFRATKKMIFLK
jgi:hypothetical protein